MKQLKIWIKLFIVSVFLIGIVALLTWHVRRFAIPSVLSKTAALETLYTLAGTKDLKITSLKGGSEATLYKVDSKDKSYVIRLIEHRSLAQKEREINAQKIASDGGWSPQLYASDVDEGWIIMEYIQPTSLTQADRMNDSLYISLGKVLQKMHTGPDFLLSSSSPIINRIEEQLEQLYKEHKIPQSIHYETLKNIFNSVKKNHSTIIAPTHRDLNPNNIIFSGHQPFIIDFEDAAQDDPFFDLGTIGAFFI
ncbi:MAG TPA: phosphotransferase [Candidatus Babeliales bacterium]|jgi:thiamine kinase-like enzyme|nr:phosphotransferase [Candidatus Babeliales bacterium]